MDNRRPTSENAPKPLNRTDNYSKEGDRQFAPRRFPPRDNQFQPRNDRFQSRDDRQRSGTERVQNRDERPSRPGINNNTGTGDNRFQPRDNRFQPRDNRTAPPRSGDSRFQPRSNDRNNRNDRDDRNDRGVRNDRNDRNDRFAPRTGSSGGRFAPRGKTLKPWEKEPPRVVSEMQVTDGRHRGKYLQSTTAEKAKPTARRIREAVFRILYRRVRAGRFLDLCAGAGTIGIEAISRGAIISTFVERSAQMCSFIKKNLETFEIKEGHGDVHQIEVVPFLIKMAKRKRQWDLVYYHPSNTADHEEVLKFFSRGVALRPGGLLIVEHPSETILPEKFGVMSRWRTVEQGDTTATFYEKKRI